VGPAVGVVGGGGMYCMVGVIVFRQPAPAEALGQLISPNSERSNSGPARTV
jgi:hypothetical protein